MLEFVSSRSVSTTGSQPVQYAVDDVIAVEWKSPFEYTTLVIWQGLDDNGAWGVETLAGTIAAHDRRWKDVR